MSKRLSVAVLHDNSWTIAHLRELVKSFLSKERKNFEHPRKTEKTLQDTLVPKCWQKYRNPLILKDFTVVLRSNKTPYFWRISIGQEKGRPSVVSARSRFGTTRV